MAEKDVNKMSKEELEEEIANIREQLSEHKTNAAELKSMYDSLVNKFAQRQKDTAQEESDAGDFINDEQQKLGLRDKLKQKIQERKEKRQAKRAKRKEENENSKIYGVKPARLGPLGIAKYALLGPAFLAFTAATILTFLTGSIVLGIFCLAFAVGTGSMVAGETVTDMKRLTAQRNQNATVAERLNKKQLAKEKEKLQDLQAQQQQIKGAEAQQNQGEVKEVPIEEQQDNSENNEQEQQQGQNKGPQSGIAEETGPETSNDNAGAGGPKGGNAEAETSDNNVGAESPENVKAEAASPTENIPQAEAGKNPTGAGAEQKNPVVTSNGAGNAGGTNKQGEEMSL